jgi:hypothetical protein
VLGDARAGTDDLRRALGDGAYGDLVVILETTRAGKWTVDDTLALLNTRARAKVGNSAGQHGNAMSNDANKRVNNVLAGVAKRDAHLAALLGQAVSRASPAPRGGDSAPVSHPGVVHAVPHSTDAPPQSSFVLEDVEPDGQWANQGVAPVLPNEDLISFVEVAV